MTMFLGIDPSLSCTAVCIGDGETHEIRLFKSKPNGRDVKARMERVNELVSDIGEFIEPHGVKLACIEGYAFQAGGGSQHAMMEFLGVLRWHLVDICEAIHEVAPTTLKKFVCDNGAADKTLVSAHIVKRWGVVCPTNDAADSYGLYRLALCCAGVTQGETAKARDAVTTVLLGPDFNAAEKADKKLRRRLETAARPPF